MNGTTQAAHQKLVSAIESSLPAILMEAVNKETAPLKEEIASLQALVNKTSSEMHEAGIKSADMIQQKQDIIEGLKSDLETKQRELAAATNNITVLTDSLNMATSELESLRKQPAQNAGFI